MKEIVEKAIVFCGVKLYTKEQKNNHTVRKYLYGVLKSRKNNEKVQYFVCGIKVYEKINYAQILKPVILKESKEIRNKISSLNALEKRLKNIEKTLPILDSILVEMKVTQVHPGVFGPYKNINLGRDVVLVCGGPSVEKFQPIEGAVYVAVNNSCSYDKVKFDYVFLQELHLEPVKNDIVDNYDYENCTKFYGVIAEKRLAKISHISKRIPQSRIKDPKLKKYYLDDRICHSFAYDLTVEPMGDYRGTAFSAMQFILWTNPKRVYIVGADCDSSGNLFNDKVQQTDYSITIKSWEMLKEFVDDIYPETEIISVNPVGLKGLFKDLYQ